MAANGAVSHRAAAVRILGVDRVGMNFIPLFECYQLNTALRPLVAGHLWRQWYIRRASKKWS
jgi:hypothetical protein